MYIYVCIVCVVYVLVCSREFTCASCVCVYEESIRSLETGNTGVCELPDVIAAIYVQVLCKGSKC